MARFAGSSKYGLDWLFTADDDRGNAWRNESIRAILLQEIRDHLAVIRHGHHHHGLTLVREIRGLRRDLKALTKALEGRKR